MARIIALVDGSVYSGSVCDHAAWAARRMGAEVVLLHVIGRREARRGDLSGSIGLGARTKLMQELAELDEQQAKLSLKRGRAILEDGAARLREDGVEKVVPVLRHGDLVEELALLEHEADLIVIGKRGEAADFAKLHLGSNLERVVRASARPVLVAARAFRPIERFTLAFDGGPSAVRALEHITKSPVFRGLKCHLLTIGEEMPDLREMLEGAEAMLREAGFEVEAEIVPGQPEKVICEQTKARETGLLVMGAYGHSRIRSMIIGSTTTAMVQGCQLPVMLFR